MIQPRKRGMGDIKCLRTDAAGNCTLIDDSASDITVNVTPSGATYTYTESGKPVFGGGGGLTQWLNQNIGTVAIGAGVFFVLIAMTKR